MVNVEIKTAIPQTPDTWQVEWEETARDRQGTPKGKPAIWRAGHCVRRRSHAANHG
jgi:type IV secretion system protein VirB5